MNHEQQLSRKSVWACLPFPAFQPIVPAQSAQVLSCSGSWFQPFSSPESHLLLPSLPSPNFPPLPKRRRPQQPAGKHNFAWIGSLGVIGKMLLETTSSWWLYGFGCNYAREGRILIMWNGNWKNCTRILIMWKGSAKNGENWRQADEYNCKPALADYDVGTIVQSMSIKLSKRTRI